MTITDRNRCFISNPIVSSSAAVLSPTVEMVRTRWQPFHGEVFRSVGLSPGTGVTGPTRVILALCRSTKENRPKFPKMSKVTPRKQAFNGMSLKDLPELCWMLEWDLGYFEIQWVFACEGIRKPLYFKLRCRRPASSSPGLRRLVLNLSC